jgi:type IV pilus assembly protein PilE
MRCREQTGFTLIEIMITLLIVAVIATIAVPSYRDYVLRAHRTEARAALLALAAAQEKYYLQFNCYAAALDPTITASTAPTNPTTCAGGKLAFPATSERGYYDIAVTGVSLTDWTATATAVAGKAQAADTKCSVYQLTGTGIKSASTAASVANNDDCWRK